MTLKFLKFILLKFIVIPGLLIVAPGISYSQIVDNYLEDEKFLYAATKQVNQFFRRFNAEEDEMGNKLYEGDQKFRDRNQRQNFIKMLFDNITAQYGDDLKKDFLQDVTDRTSPKFLDFHGGEWFAEVNATFEYNGKEQPAILFLKLEEENLGSKWVFDRIHFEPYDKLFNIDTIDQRKFLHPMSHELDFMNLRKVFRDASELEDYTSKSYRPDFLSIFLYEIKKSELKFKTIKNVKFHFFQIDNWYFEISEFNRRGYNKGWLISNLVQVSEEDKDLLVKYIYFNN